VQRVEENSMGESELKGEEERVEME
jgi:hypothetical protein